MSLFFNNFYSTTQQYSLLQQNAFDEGPIKKLKFVGINTSSIDTTEVDPYRQGVELTQNKHSLGIFKISAGTPGHIVKPVCFGINDLDIISTGSYVEVEYFDPVQYLKAQDPGKTLKYAVTFPIITADSNQQENYGFNGIIEPLTIRPVISFFSIEFPFESHAFRGALMGGNPDKFGFSSDQVLSVDYVPTKLVPLKDLSSGTFSGYVEGNRAYENKAWFLDAHEGKLEGSLSVDSPGLPLNGAGYTNGDVNFLSAFNDNKVYLEELGITVETHGADMVEVFKVMTGSTGNYIPPGKKSATSGFIYDAVGYTGTDSVAFGGMTY